MKKHWKNCWVSSEILGCERTNGGTNERTESNSKDTSGSASDQKHETKLTHMWNRWDTPQGIYSSGLSLRYLDSTLPIAEKILPYQKISTYCLLQAFFLLPSAIVQYWNWPQHNWWNMHLIITLTLRNKPP